MTTPLYTSGQSTIHLKRQMILRQCPVTCGLPTRMNADGWQKICRSYQLRAKKLRFGGIERDAESMSYCVICKGKKMPRELTIIKKEEIDMGRAKERTGTCELCNKPGMSLRHNHGFDACGMCQALQARVANHPELVIHIIRRMHAPEKVAELLGAKEVIESSVELDLLRGVLTDTQDILTERETILDSIRFTLDIPETTQFSELAWHVRQLRERALAPVTPANGGTAPPDPQTKALADFAIRMIEGGMVEVRSRW